MGQHVHVLLAYACTAGGLNSMLVFVLCTMYSKTALATPSVGSRLFEYFLKKTANQRTMAFWFMYGSGIVLSFNMLTSSMAVPTFIQTTEVSARLLDTISVVMSC